jgi:hypothetical protein
MVKKLKKMERILKETKPFPKYRLLHSQIVDWVYFPLIDGNIFIEKEDNMCP